MNNKKSILFGVLVLILTIGLNVRHVMNDYGVKGNKLHVEVLAESSTTSGGYVIGVPGTNWKTYIVPCTITQTFGGSIIFAPGGVGGSVTAQTTISYTVDKECCGKGSGWCLAAAGC